MSPEPFALGEGLLQVVPVCHYKVEFARAVRRAIQHFGPDKVALELAPGLAESYLAAVARFPYLSILAVNAPTLGPEAQQAAEELNLSPEDLEALHSGVILLPVEPTDAFAEAVRTARELDKPVHFVDLEIRHYPNVWEPMPDPASVSAIGLQRFYEEYEAQRNRALDSPLDSSREEHMAARLRQLTADGSRVMLICGMAHAAGILERFGRQPALQEGVEPLPVTLCEPELSTVRAIAYETPLLMTLYELTRGGPGPEHAWVGPPSEEEPEEPERPSSPLDELKSGDVMRSLEMLLGMKTTQPEPEEPLDPDLLRRVAGYLNSLQDPRMTAASFGLPPEMEFLVPKPAGAQSRTPAKVFKFKQVSDRRDELLDIYARINADSRTPDGTLDRQRVLVKLCQVAADFHHQNTGETIQRWQFQVLFQYVRNYARLKGYLLPGIFELLMGARGVADDNYSYEVWDLGTFYPWSDPSGALQTIRIDGDQLNLGGMQLKRWTFHRRLPRLRQMRAPVKTRRQESEPGEWTEQFQPGRICSYPPEDIVIEDYGRYLQKKAITTLSEERARVEPFSTSLLDGIDMRETIRNWHDRQDIYVREVQRVKGGAGSVVIIFDDDLSDARYPWKMTWHGEHAQESDMAFYSTPAQAKIVGPGIARCEYGGLMLTYPPRRLEDVWNDPFYASALTKSEVLLFAAIEYCVERHVVYVAPKPPRSYFRTFAARFGKKVVYMPLGQLSPVSLKRLRVFHVLNGHRLRQIAKDYIW